MCETLYQDSHFVSHRTHFVNYQTYCRQILTSGDNRRYIMDEAVYIVFTKSQRHWWTCFLHDTINHCYLIKPDNGRWVVYGKAHKGMDLHTIDNHNDILVDSLVIRVEPKETKQGLFMLNTCVGNVKQYLGIKKPFLWTPFQLMNYLVEML